MRQNSAKRPFFPVLIFLVAFLCCLPAVSRAVQPSDSLPEITDSCEVSPDTTVVNLYAIFQIAKSMKLTVYKTDGSTRPAGYVETGDRAVVRDSGGDLIDCILITVQGQPAESSSVSSATSSESSQEVSSGSSVPASEVPQSEIPSTSAQPASSETPQSDSSQPDSTPSPAPEPVAKQGLILNQSIDVSSAVSLLSGEANRVTVFAPDGSARKSGLICTGDRLVLQDESGSVFRTMTVTVLGDLTRCGRPTETGCSLLYSYLTGNTSLPADLSDAADINRDQRIDTADLLRIKQMLLENSSSPGN